MRVAVVQLSSQEDVTTNLQRAVHWVGEAAAAGAELVVITLRRSVALHLLALFARRFKEAFDRLCDNLNPADGSKLTVRTRADRTVGYDFTWSVPKSVSLLYAMSGDQGIMDAFRSAVDELRA